MVNDILLKLTNCRFLIYGSFIYIYIYIYDGLENFAYLGKLGIVVDMFWKL
jgi:hypothetical protein